LAAAAERVHFIHGRRSFFRYRPDASERYMSKGLQIAIGTLTVFAGVVWLVTLGGGSEGTFAYYTSVGEFVAATAGEAEPRNSRVHGFVLEGSIAKDLPAGRVDFSIHDRAGGVLPVRLDGVELPDLFRDGAEVVVEGRLEGQRFVATQVLAKCPSKYEAETTASRPSL
jgi:cytochrome c-type biogenesis protein CcmE